MPSPFARLLCLTALAAAGAIAAGPPARAQLRLVDESDRAAFRAWFVFLSDAQFYRPAAEVGDCAALVRHAFREALRAHTPEWLNAARLPLVPGYPDVRRPPPARGRAWALFRTSAHTTAPDAEFADARTIVRYNARPLGRDVSALRPGDLLYFRQPAFAEGFGEARGGALRARRRPGQRQPDHLMVFVGPSRFEREGADWVVYHTGPISRPASGVSRGVRLQPDLPASGEVRKVRLADLMRHPEPRWRPVAGNAAFVGIYRLSAP